MYLSGNFPEGVVEILSPHGSTCTLALCGYLRKYLTANTLV